MGMGPMTIEAESRSVSTLIANLDSDICLNIDPLPDFACGTELRAVPSSFVMEGGSHAARMAGLVPSSLPSFTCEAEGQDAQLWKPWT
jgi:hypothetical protein